MKKVIFTIVIIFAYIVTIAQKWEQTIGEPELNEGSQSLIEHYDKGYFITADLWGGNNGTNGLLIKTDINGNVLWEKEIGVDPDVALIHRAIYDTEGNFFIFGGLKQGLPVDWPVIIKLNACGEKQWCALSAYTENTDGFYQDGIILDNGDLLGLAYMPDEQQVDMIYLICISPYGEFKWKKSYVSKSDYPTFGARSGKRIQKFDDIYIISGYVYSPHPSNPNIVSLRPMFIGVDTLFNEQWVLEFGLEDNMKGKAVESIAINDSLFIGVGRYRYTASTGMTKDAWAMYYNDKGEQVGYTTIEKEKLGTEVLESTFYEIERVNDSLYIATSGIFYGEEEDYVNGEIIFDTTGNVYNYAWRDESNGHPSLIKTFDDKFVVSTSLLYEDLTWDIFMYKIQENLEQDTVYPGSYNYDSLCTNLPIQSGVIDLAGCDIITDIKDIPTLEKYNNRKNKVIISAFPNPTSDGSITLSFQNTEYFEDMELRCFDMFGKQMYTEIIHQFQGETKINISNWQKGIYFVIVYADGKAVGHGKFVVQ